MGSNASRQKDTLQMIEDKAIAPLIPPVGEDDPWRDVNHYHWNHANEDARPCLNANCCRPHWMDEHQVEAAITLTLQQHAEQIAEKDREIAYSHELTAEAGRLTHQAESREAALRAELVEEQRDNERLEREIETLKQEQDERESALKVIRSGLGAKCQETGDFWQAREWLKKHGIYEGDLSGERVLLLVAKHALKQEQGK